MLFRSILFLLAPTLLLDAISCVIRTCYLIPQNKEHIYIRATILGAMLNFFVNSLLIPEWGYFGACIGTIAAVLSMMAVHVFYIRKIISIPKIFNILSPFLLKAVSMLIVIFLIGKVIQRRELRVPLQIVFGVLSYIMLNLKFLVTEFWRYKKE